MFKSVVKGIIQYFFPSIIKVEFVKKEVPVQVLSPTQLKALRARLPNPALSSSDTEVTAAHKLGVQLALQELEKGFVG